MNDRSLSMPSDVWDDLMSDKKVRKSVERFAIEQERIETEYPYAVNFISDPNLPFLDYLLTPEQSRWLEKNVKGRYRIFDDALRFKDEDIAVWFKLIFGGESE